MTSTRPTRLKSNYRQTCKFCGNVLQKFQRSFGICGYCLAENERASQESEGETYDFGYQDEVDVKSNK